MARGNHQEKETGSRSSVTTLYTSSLQELLALLENDDDDSDNLENMDDDEDGSAMIEAARVKWSELKVYIMHLAPLYNKLQVGWIYYGGEKRDCIWWQQ